MKKNYRIDPTHPKETGIHIVDAENGFERVMIPYTQIPLLIQDLKKIYGEYRNDLL